jgi:glycosyltransferase involved in cell wall biosynthesis
LGKSGAFTKANVVLERIIGGMATRMLVVSEVDRRAYQSLGLSENKIMVLPTCADMDQVKRKTMTRSEARRLLGIEDRQKVILFFGTLNYRPNLLSAKYVVEQLAPKINGFDDTRIYIAGSGTFSYSIPQNVRFLGFVPDIYAWLAASDVCIAPIWEGVGILTKVIDMLSMGTPTVVSPLAIEGIPELENRVNCLIGKDPEDFATQLICLLADTQLQARLGAEGRKLVESKYSWKMTAPLLFQMLERIDEMGKK